MMGGLNQILDQVSKEKSIDRAILVEALEQGILSAAKKTFGHGREIEAKYSDEIGQVELMLYMQVVDDGAVEIAERDLPITTARIIDPEVQVADELGFQIFYLDKDRASAEEEDRKYGDVLGIKTARQQFGRIAAMTAKQVIMQRVRDAEREVIFNEYKDRKGELVTGITRRFERGNVIVDLGRAEAVLPVREQMFRESYRAGDRVQAYVKEIKRDAKGPQVVLSRTDSRLIEKLFELEVPEIYEGIVKVMAVAREPGERAKIAVASKDSDVDPVGACVGMKGSRVQAVVQELRGEKIDIVPWSPDIAKFVCNAIQPAEVSRVLIDEDNQTIELIVPDDQLSLAIGRRGQNVRLASKLVGWKIEIQSEGKIEDMKKQLGEALKVVPDLDESLVSYLFKLGYHSPDNLLNAHVEDLAGIPGITEEMAMQVQQIAFEVKKKRDEEARIAKEAAVRAAEEAAAQQLAAEAVAAEAGSNGAADHAATGEATAVAGGAAAEADSDPAHAQGPSSSGVP
jgi:N utilization substance protein A